MRFCGLLWQNLVLLLLLVACARPTPAKPVPWSGTLQLQVTSSSKAGEPVPVVLVGDAPDGTAALLTVLGSYGPRLYRANFVGGAALFALPPADTAAAGRVTLVATVGATQVTDGLSITPGAPSSVAAPLVAPRSVCAGGTEASLVTLVAADALGNPVADGTALTLRASFTGEAGITLALPTEGGLAVGRISVGPQAGRTGVWAEVNGARSLDTPLAVVACVPANIPLVADPPILPADGRTTATLRAGPISDAAGNLLADGTLVIFLAELTDGSRRIPATIQGGMAAAPFLAPITPGQATVRVLVLGVLSEPITVAVTDPRPEAPQVPLAQAGARP